MKTIRHFPVTDELRDALDDGETIEKLNWRHGHINLVVFAFDGAHWQVPLHIHHEEGWQLGSSIDAVKVCQVEKTVKVWVAEDDPG